MKVVLTGACGFAGSTIAAGLLAARTNLEIIGVDNLSRPGSELNRMKLARMGVKLRHLDIRNISDISVLDSADWVVDAAANPSVLGGVDGQKSSRQIVEHNLIGTINLLEYCKEHHAGFILLSTSRVYSVATLSTIGIAVVQDGYRPVPQKIRGLTPQGISEEFSTESPLSLYGATKRVSEQLALEYGNSFEFPVWINRSGVLAGAGQFGKADQGMFSYWIHSYRWRKPLNYIGFDANGHQVRDCLHPRDLVPVLLRQMERTSGPAVCNFSGGIENSMSLRQLSDWCALRFGRYEIGRDRRTRPFDVPWLVLDSSQAHRNWNWQPQTSIASLLEEISAHADANPDWLEISAYG
jgi:CDP-paratose 2-epimerase